MKTGARTIQLETNEPDASKSCDSISESIRFFEPTIQQPWSKQSILGKFEMF